MSVVGCWYFAFARLNYAKRKISDIISERNAKFFLVQLQPTNVGCFSLSSLFLFPRSVHSEGTRIYGMSAEAVSRGEAVVASVSDASAIWYNPAAMTNLPNFDLSINTLHWFIPSNYTSLGGVKEENKRYYFPIPSIYLSSKAGIENFAVGLGINTPFGLATEYSNNSSFRYITTGGEVILYNFNPSVAYRLSSNLSLGAGLDYYHSSAELRKQYNWAALGIPAPDGSVTVTGKGDGFGFNLGFLFQPSETQSVGLAYRSQVTVDYSGENGTVTGIPAAAVLGGLFPAGTADFYKTGARTTLRFPDILSFGYAVRPTEKLLVEIGGHWTNWNDADSLNVHFDQPTAGLPDDLNDLDWKNGWVLRIGAEYQCYEQLSFSAGYFFDKSPVSANQATYSPLIPDGNHHVFSIGAKYERENFVIRVPFEGFFQTGTKNIDSNVRDVFGIQNVDGKYGVFGYQIGIGFEYKI